MVSPLHGLRQNPPPTAPPTLPGHQTPVAFVLSWEAPDSSPPHLHVLPWLEDLQAQLLIIQAPV